MEKTFKFTATGKAQTLSGTQVPFTRRGYVDAPNDAAATNQVVELIEHHLTDSKLALAETPAIRLSVA